MFHFMMTDEQRAVAMGLLSNHPVAVIATADTTGVPGAAVVLFAETPEFGIVFATHPTRKFYFLQQNPKTAFAFSKDWAAVQMHGTSKEIAGADAEKMKALFMKKHPEFNKHLLEGSAFFLFQPTWMRYMDNGAKPPVMWEVNF